MWKVFRFSCIVILLLLWGCQSGSLKEEIQANYKDNETLFIELQTTFLAAVDEKEKKSDAYDRLMVRVEELLKETNCKDVRMWSFPNEVPVIEIKYRDVGPMQGAYYVMHSAPVDAESERRIEAEQRLIRNNVYWLLK